MSSAEQWMLAFLIVISVLALGFLLTGLVIAIAGATELIIQRLPAQRQRIVRLRLAWGLWVLPYRGSAGQTRMNWLTFCSSIILFTMWFLIRERDPTTIYAPMALVAGMVSLGQSLPPLLQGKRGRLAKMFRHERHHNAYKPSGQGKDSDVAIDSKDGS